MLLTKVVLKDYGVYQGKNEFDFTCTADKPIILIGGTNGAGKTTLFESVMLCLYGISSLGKRITKKTYEGYLAKKIHRYVGTSTSADLASIIVQFKYYHEGKEIEYQVERTWRKEDKLIEQLNIKKRTSDQEDFVPLETIEEAHWQSFVEELIPKGIAKLFFFDGEKIVEIAEEGSEDLAIKSSFNSLLGIDVVEQLRSDLQVNLMRNLTNDDKFLRDEFEKYTNEKKEAQEQIAHFREKLAQKNSEMEHLRSEIEELEAGVSKIGGEFASKREETKSRLAVKKLTLENISKRIQELCAGPLPFSLIPNELEQVKLQIQKDEEIQKKELENKIVKTRLKKVDAELNDDSFWNELKIEQNTREKIRQKLLKSLDVKTSEKQEKGLFNFSISQANKILSVIEEANTTALTKIEKDSQKYIEVAEDIVKLETSLANAPSDDELGPLITKLNEKHSEAGSLKTEIDHLETQIASNDSLIRHVNVKIREIVSKQFKNEKSQTKAELTEKVQKVLDEYVERLKIRKLKLLETYLLDAIHLLMHKKNFITKVSINKETFEVTLYRKNDDPLPKDLLSKGEKQMFATAVLWGLAKTSGKPLPFMIDTPLARLDEGHRINLVEKFLPIASHQVAIFSTDSEITLDHYEKLKPHINRAYAMEFLPEKGTTKQHSGYFWNDKGEKVVAVQQT